MITLQPLRFPRPVPIPIWSDDYADIPERIRRAGRFDTEEIWLAHSGDGWTAFCGRHGTQDFFYDFRQLEERRHYGFIRTEQQRAEHEQQVRSARAEQARREQEAWEAERREREQAKQAAADREWQAIENAKAYWSQRRPVYATESYHTVTINVTGKIDGVQLLAGKSYWVPYSINQRLRAYVKNHNLQSVT